MTYRTRAKKLLSLLLSWGLLAALCLACTVESGDRAASGGACPEDEICSEATPEGLTFYGPQPADDASGAFLRAVALGGRATLGFSAGTWSLEDDGRDAGRLGAYTVESSAPWFLAAGDPADDRPEWAYDFGEHSVMIEGLAEGESQIRVVEPETGALYDRITIEVARIAEVTGHTLSGEPLVAGERATVVFYLEGADETRLVDEDMTISADVELTRASWDGVDLTAPDADEVTFTLDAGHRRWGVTLPVTR